jgi:nucleotide-binding universal stress UspA family protein
VNDIIVGVGKSESAKRAAQAAAELAAATGDNLHIVMSVSKVSSRDVAIGGERYHTDDLAESENFLRELARQLPHDKITTMIGVGEPAEVLCDEAKRLDARMIVVGNLRVQSISRILGAIANEVAQKAPCDVLICHTVGK